MSNRRFPTLACGSRWARCWLPWWWRFSRRRPAKLLHRARRAPRPRTARAAWLPWTARTGRRHRAARTAVDAGSDLGRRDREVARRARCRRAGRPAAGRSRHSRGTQGAAGPGSRRTRDARRDARAAVSVADEACVLADVASRQSKRQAELLSRKLTSDDIADQAKGNADAGAATCKARRASASVANRASPELKPAWRATRPNSSARTCVRRSPAAVLDIHAKVGELVGAEGVLELGRVQQMYAIARCTRPTSATSRSGRRHA